MLDIATALRMTSAWRPCSYFSSQHDHRGWERLGFGVFLWQCGHSGEAARNPDQIQAFLETYRNIENAGSHKQLQADLIQHHWMRHGGNWWTFFHLIDVLFKHLFVFATNFFIIRIWTLVVIRIIVSLCAIENYELLCFILLYYAFEINYVAYKCWNMQKPCFAV